MCGEMMLSISFRANQTVSNQQQKNLIGLTENGQKVLNSTNKYANTYDFVDTVVDKDKRKENLGTVAKNALLMPVMSNPIVGAAYTANQYNKGNISKDDAIKIFAYNSIAQGLSS